MHLFWIMWRSSVCPWRASVSSNADVFKNRCVTILLVNNSIFLLCVNEGTDILWFCFYTILSQDLLF